MHEFRPVHSPRVCIFKGMFISRYLIYSPCFAQSATITASSNDESRRHPIREGSCELPNSYLIRWVTPTSPPMSTTTQTPEKLHTSLSLTSMPETSQLVKKQSTTAGQPQQLKHSLRGQNLHSMQKPMYKHNNETIKQ